MKQTSIKNYLKRSRLAADLDGGDGDHSLNDTSLPERRLVAPQCSNTGDSNNLVLQASAAQPDARLPPSATNGPVSSRLSVLADLVASTHPECSVTQLIADQLRRASFEVKSSLVPRTKTASVNNVAGTLSNTVSPALDLLCQKMKNIEHNLLIVKNAVKASSHSDLTHSGGLFLAGGRPRAAPERGTDVSCLCVIPNASVGIASSAQKALENHPSVASGEVNVDLFNIHPSGNIYVHTRSPEEASRASIILSSAGIAVRNVKKKRPRYLFTPLPLETKESDFISWLESADVRFSANKGSAVLKKLKLNSAQCALLLEVDPALGTLIDSEPFFSYKLRKRRIKKFFDLLQCKHCARYGHLAKFCRFQNERTNCTTCGSDKCGERCSSPRTPFCANCSRANLASTGHPSWDKTCPIRRGCIRSLDNT